MARYCPFCRKKLTKPFMIATYFGFIKRTQLWLCCGIPISRKMARRRP